jgi:penicillin amidase
LLNTEAAVGKVKPELIQNLKEIENLGLLPSVEGSNSWVIAGKHTESGKPILASDPHLTNSIPSNFYQFEGCYLKNSKKYCMNAFSVPGSIIIPGRYNYIAVAPTTIYLDTIDFFKEKVKNDMYFVDG